MLEHVRADYFYEKLINKKPVTYITGLFIFGAGGRNRTPDLLITNQLLYQLSYTSVLGGNNRARTYDPLLVRQMLSQLSYAPKSAYRCNSILKYTKRKMTCQP